MKRTEPTNHCIHYCSLNQGRSIQVFLSKFKKLFCQWNPLKVQKLPFLYWPLETTDPVHTIKSEQCWSLLLLLANVSQKIILKENLYLSILSIGNAKYSSLEVEVGQGVRRKKVRKIVILVKRKGVWLLPTLYLSLNIMFLLHFAVCFKFRDKKILV